MTHLLFFNRTHSVRALDPRLSLRVQPAIKEPRTRNG